MKSGKELNKMRGQRLSECRKDLHLSQELLAEKTGYSIQTISYIENGKRGMTTDTARIFAKALNTRAEYLLCDDDHKTVLHLYRHASTATRLEHNIMDVITELGYLPIEVEGDVIAHVSPSDTDNEDEIIDECDIIKIEKHIIATPENNLITCSEKEYRNLVEDIYDYIKMRLKQFEKRSAPATTEEKKLFVSEFHSEEKKQEMLKLFRERGADEEFIKSYIFSETAEKKSFLKKYDLTEEELKPHGQE